MRITINDYAYVYVKLAALKQIIMSADDLRKIKSLSDLDSLTIFAARFFPGFNPTDKTVAGFEKTLWGIYFQLIEKILVASPEPMQIFLKNTLVKHEIAVIKTIVYGEITKIPIDNLFAEMSFKPTEILEHTTMMKSLVKSKNVDEISKILQHSIYGKAFEEGYRQFKKTNETFYLGQSFDKVYYDNMLESINFYPEPEKGFIEEYIRLNVDIYNLNLIFRSLYNRISLKLIETYLIPKGNIFQESEIRLILKQCSDINSFIKIIGNLSRKYKNLKDIALEMQDQNPDALERIRERFIQGFIARFQRDIIEDIPLSTIYRTFLIVIQKEYEIHELIKRTAQITIAAQR